jgi:hypothetical protein
VTPHVLKIPFAVKVDGTPVHIDDFDGSGFRADCLCPECHQPLVARKGAIKIHHFAHEGDHSCNGETILHLLAKAILRQRIEAAIASGAPVPMKWACGRCGYDHSGNLVKRARRVRLEQRVATKIPDLQLLDAQEAVCGVVEVIVTHAPDQSAREVYATREIPIVEIRVESAADLTILRDSPSLAASAVSYCPVPERELRTVTLANLPIRMFELKLEHVDCDLWVTDRANSSLTIRFSFDTPAIAAEALYALRSGIIDGINDADWMIRHCKNRFLHRDLVLRIARGLREFKMNWRGFGKHSWKRDRKPRLRGLRYS